MSICVSFSGMQLYDQCPSAFQRRYIEKEVTAGDGAPSDAMLRGSRIHKGCENYLLDKGDLPDEAEGFTELFKAMKHERQAQPEVKFAFNEDWEPTKFSDKETAQVRGILDIIHTNGDTCYVNELKTGKKYPEHSLQRSLYGLAGGLLHPECSTIVVQTVYLDQNEVVPMTLHRDQLPTYTWTWQRFINKCQPPQPYPQRPSWKCRFCAYHEGAGGTCNGERTG
jgi:hypothetical protein